jgi:hypothetical protein
MSHLSEQKREENNCSQTNRLEKQDSFSRTSTTKKKTAFNCSVAVCIIQNELLETGVCYNQSNHESELSVCVEYSAHVRSQKNCVTRHQLLHLKFLNVEIWRYKNCLNEYSVRHCLKKHPLRF